MTQPIEQIVARLPRMGPKPLKHMFRRKAKYWLRTMPRGIAHTQARWEVTQAVNHAKGRRANASRPPVEIYLTQPMTEWFGAWE